MRGGCCAVKHCKQDRGRATHTASTVNRIGAWNVNCCGNPQSAESPKVPKVRIIVVTRGNPFCAIPRDPI